MAIVSDRQPSLWTTDDSASPSLTVESESCGRKEIAFHAKGGTSGWRRFTVCRDAFITMINMRGGDQGMRGPCCVLPASAASKWFQ